MGNTSRKHMGYILKFTEDDRTPYDEIAANNKNDLIDQLIYMLQNTASLYLTEDSDFA